jgi:hypothetical protein
MEIIELRTETTHRNIDWAGTLEDFLDGARTVGHVVAPVHGIPDRWLVFNPVTMTWCEVGRPPGVIGNGEAAGAREA